MKKEIATKTRTNEILKKYNLIAKKGYGQNFIIEPKIVRKIADYASDENGCVIEIGPGIGALSEQLALRNKSLIAYEIDDNLIEVLNDTLSLYDNVQIINLDFLKCDLESLIKNLRKDFSRVVICANLPYYITTPILFKIFECVEQVDEVVVMMQKEVADRFCAKVSTKEYNALSVIAQSLYDIKIVMNISKEIFNPKPSVASCVVSFIGKKNKTYIEQKEFFDFVKACFKQRRKTLYNNLKEYYHDNDKAEQTILNSGLELNIRAEALSLDSFKNLFERRVK
ncbi:MAG: 16S rRNA (adenine(1518)-N(6)/adenine(1519)-N(6))-dimethyltransferase RsmA [Anaerorhabdus sp.]